MFFIGIRPACESQDILRWERKMIHRLDNGLMLQQVSVTKCDMNCTTNMNYAVFPRLPTKLMKIISICVLQYLCGILSRKFEWDIININIKNHERIIIRLYQYQYPKPVLTNFHVLISHCISLIYVIISEYCWSRLSLNFCCSYRLVLPPPHHVQSNAYFKIVFKAPLKGLALKLVCE